MNSTSRSASTPSRTRRTRWVRIGTIMVARERRRCRVALDHERAPKRCGLDALAANPGFGQEPTRLVPEFKLSCG